VLGGDEMVSDPKRERDQAANLCFVVTRAEGAERMRLWPFIVRAHGAMQEVNVSASYPHDEFGNGICTKSERDPDQMRPR
jgi:hypothetical protein